MSATRSMMVRLNYCSANAQNRRSVLAAATTGFSEFTARNGGVPERIFRRAGLAEAQLADMNQPIDLGTYVQMLELAAVDTGNDNFGLLYGQQFKPEMLGLIGALAIASPTLGAALANLARLFPYHQQATHTAFTRHGGYAHLEYRILDGSIVDRRHDAELTIGMFVNVVRHCLGAGWAPEAIQFEHPRPRVWRQHQQAFAAPVHFGQRNNVLILREDMLHHRMPQGDLQQTELVRDELLRVGRDAGVLSLLDRVKGEIRSHLPEGVPLVELIAAAVGMPRWTLQRRLATHGLSFTEVVDMVRRELADSYIRQYYVPLSDIGDILGYSELSAFSRAFRRWFGTPPQSFRRHLR